MCPFIFMSFSFLNFSPKEPRPSYAGMKCRFRTVCITLTALFLVIPSTIDLIEPTLRVSNQFINVLWCALIKLTNCRCSR